MRLDILLLKRTFATGRFLLALALSMFSWFASSQPGAAQPFTQVIVFGDSNVDSGYYKALSNPGGGATFNADWPTAVAHGAGAPTTNPNLMNSQMLAGYFGLTANPSNTPNGTNYATSGAKNVTINNSQTGGFTEAIPTVTQISNYLTANGGVANSQALYLIHSGDNDIKYALGQSGTGPYPPDPNAYMTTAASQLATAVQSLSTAGAKTIIVAGLAYDFPTGSGNATERALKLLYTQSLWNDLTNAGVVFIRGDVDTVRLAIAANPTKYGFTAISPANPACTQPTGITTAWALLCSSDPAAPSTWVSATAPSTNLFADDQHLATAGQRYFANYYRNLIAPGPATHDFNADHKSDILWRNTSSGDVALWLMNGASVSVGLSVANVPLDWSIVGQRDFNGDGKYDILWDDASGNVAIWLMNGGTISSSVLVGNVGTSWSVAGTGDFNSDSKGDILWHDTSGNVAIWLMNGGSISSAAFVGNVSTTWSIAGSSGNSILWRDTSGNVALWGMNGGAISSSVSLGNVPLSWSIVGAGDFDGDGFTDILWHDDSGNVAIWLMGKGGTIASSVFIGNVPTTWSIVQIGDFNGDGKSDILWRDTAGDVAMWEMNGGSVLASLPVATVPGSWSIQASNAH